MEMRRKSNRGYRVFNRVSTVLVGLFALLCLLPFLLLLIGSFTDNDVVVRNGYSFFPQKWSVDSYVYLFRNPQGLINAYKVTIITTLATTVFGLFLTAMTGYALSRQDFRSRNVFSFMFYFTQTVWRRSDPVVHGHHPVPGNAGHHVGADRSFPFEQLQHPADA